MHSTPVTRSRRERLADRARSDSLLPVLALVALLALAHPVVPVAALVVLCGRRLGRATRSPTGHGRVRRLA